MSADCHPVGTVGVGGTGCAAIVTLTPLEIVDAPALSNAFAESVKVPAVELFHVALYGLLMSVDTSVEPA